MQRKTILRAFEITENAQVIPISISPTYNEFEVTQRDGTRTKVWYSLKKKVIQWSCNAVNLKKDGTKFGCVFFKGDHTKPFCSHTLSAQLYLGGLGNEKK